MIFINQDVPFNPDHRLIIKVNTNIIKLSKSIFIRPRLGVSTWETDFVEDKEPSIQIDFRQPVIIKAIQLLSLLDDQFGTLKSVRTLTIEYLKKDTFVSYLPHLKLYGNT